METISLLKEIKELKTQLAYSRNIGFFFGAGTSCSLNIPNIEQITNTVGSSLTGELKTHYDLIMEDLKTICAPKIPNIEDVLNQIRRIRDLTREVKTKNYLGIDGDSAKKLDKEICVKIYDIILEKENVADLDIPKRFFAWLSILNREFSKEIFTSNYDLIIEKSLEASQIPYFDGFVGAYEPFFWQESIDSFIGSEDLTKNWIRLWKIHGSLSWFWKEEPKTRSHKIIRIGRVDKNIDKKDELVIYPSKEKYDSSRKQPFVAYFDRLKNYLLSGELLFIFTGYSFSDQHINEVVFNCLRQNNRLFVLVFFFKDEEVENLHKLTSKYMNLNVFGPKKAIINGNLGEWEFKELEDFEKDKKPFNHFWEKIESKFILGDFKQLVNFLIANSGKKDAIETIVK